MVDLANAAQWMALSFSPDGLITSVSASAEHVTGYSAQELVGRPITHLMCDRTAFEVPHMMQTAREWGSWEGDIVHRFRSGKAFEAHGELSLLSDRENTFTGYFLVSAINGAVEKGFGSDGALTAVAAKLRAICHEMNNPLAVMLGFVQLILLNRDCEGKIRTDMEKVFSEMQRVIHSVGRLHSYALTLQEKDATEQPSGEAEPQNRTICS
jgi:PAS domain S-box-containing protein